MESWKHLKWSVNIINYTTSIARCFKTGAFHYKVKIKFNGIEFNKIYLNAFKWLFSSYVQVLSVPSSRSSRLIVFPFFSPETLCSAARGWDVPRSVPKVLLRCQPGVVSSLQLRMLWRQR